MRSGSYSGIGFGQWTCNAHGALFCRRCMAADRTGAVYDPPRGPIPISVERISPSKAPTSGKLIKSRRMRTTAK